MPFTGILPPLLFCLVFVLVAGWLYRRGYKKAFLAPAFTALMLAGATLAVYVQDRQHTQAVHDLDDLLTELDRDDLYTTGGLRDPQRTLFFFSTASLALYRARAYAPQRDSIIQLRLGRMAGWAVRSDRLKQWRSGNDWDREVYFLAHAGAVLGHFQLASNDERHAERFARIGRYLGERLRRGHYKHLGSHPNEELLRPADNAAAIYTLTLYDAYYGERMAPPTRKDWSEYIDRELHYAESRLPCAAFTATNRCSVEPSAAATGLYITYRAASAGAVAVDDIPYREWLHYFKRFSGNPFSLSIRPSMRTGRTAKLCDTGLGPLSCGAYEQAIGMWAAAEYGGGYTYFRLLCGRVFDRWFGGPTGYEQMRPARRVQALTELALASVAQGSWPAR